jgi:hypothetical protein
MSGEMWWSIRVSGEMWRTICVSGEMWRSIRVWGNVAEHKCVLSLPTVPGFNSLQSLKAEPRTVQYFL